jgi:hypothetical protein
MAQPFFMLSVGQGSSGAHAQPSPMPVPDPSHIRDETHVDAAGGAPGAGWARPGPCSAPSSRQTDPCQWQGAQPGEPLSPLPTCTPGAPTPPPSDWAEPRWKPEPQWSQPEMYWHLSAGTQAGSGAVPRHAPQAGGPGWGQPYLGGGMPIWEFPQPGASGQPWSGRVPSFAGGSPFPHGPSHMMGYATSSGGSGGSGQAAWPVDARTGLPVGHPGWGLGATNPSSSLAPMGSFAHPSSYGWHWQPAPAPPSASPLPPYLMPTWPGVPEGFVRMLPVAPGGDMGSRSGGSQGGAQAQATVGEEPPAKVMTAKRRRAVPVNASPLGGPGLGHRDGDVHPLSHHHEEEGEAPDSPEPAVAGVQKRARQHADTGSGDAPAAGKGDFPKPEPATGCAPVRPFTVLVTLPPTGSPPGRPTSGSGGSNSGSDLESYQYTRRGDRSPSPDSDGHVAGKPHAREPTAKLATASAKLADLCRGKPEGPLVRCRFCAYASYFTTKVSSVLLPCCFVGAAVRLFSYGLGFDVQRPRSLPTSIGKPSS